MTRKALLIGINRYRIPGSDLRGCVNDVKSMAGALQRWHGFAEADIATLLDDAATQKAIQAGIKALLKGAKAGDVRYLHYSGHGANTPDKNGDEADQRDEILCPHDLDWKKPLTDDWLRKQFDAVPAGVNLTVVMDCCHSGTNTRALLPPDAPVVNRFLPNPLDLYAVESGRKLKGKVQVGMRSATPAQRKKSDVVVVDIPEVLISGCRDNQTSADALIGKTYHGALTHQMVAALKAAKGQLSYRQLHADTLKGIQEIGLEQVPQLEGRDAHLDRLFLAPLA